MKRFLAILFATAVLAGCNDDNDTQQYDYLTFENVGAQYLAGPTPAGENLYYDYAGDQYTGYSDAITGLIMRINTDAALEWNFWNGGIAISQWNCMADNDPVTAKDYRNQCSVYFKAANGNGGHNGSKTFAVAHCPAWLTSNAALYFEGGKTERVFDHFWVANSTYTALTMRDGGNFGAKAFSYEDYDWLLLTIEGYDKAGVKKGEVPFYLANFLTGGGGIVTEWTKVDLSALGRVNRLEFKISGSDNNDYGLTAPSYFCFDDIAIRR